jgi:FixJ family two-component response regulator
MTLAPPLVAVIDDDESVREALPGRIRQFGYQASVFSSAEEFLRSDRLVETNCAIIDIAMPGVSGLDLQRELLQRGWRIPIIFITADGNGELRARLQKLGAIDCLLKPFTGAALQAAIVAALSSD